jgi:biotin synthase
MEKSEMKKLIDLPFLELLSIADGVRREGVGTDIELCGIVNAKSGKCTEDCKFCAQSGHYSTKIKEYPLISIKNIIIEAKQAELNGARQFGIVTSGNRLNKDEIGILGEAIRTIKNETGLSVCASLGAIDENAFEHLKESGLTRYHHNIETSEHFYSRIVSTHEYSERTTTIKLAKQKGLEVCSGGIIGLGESWDDRIAMAILLNELEVDAIPLNVLMPLKGTPLEKMEPISPFDVIRTIALFRIANKNRTIKVAAGRESVLKDYGALIYMAGANGMMIGGYLTVGGRPVTEDQVLVREVEALWNKS